VLLSFVAKGYGLSSNDATRYQYNTVGPYKTLGIPITVPYDIIGNGEEVANFIRTQLKGIQFQMVLQTNVNGGNVPNQYKAIN
jgi:hypothetical protein